MLKLNILEKTKNGLKIELEGEGHTFCNILQHTLLQDNTVEMAGYDIPHPLISSPILLIRMKENRSPEKALVRALSTIKDTTDTFLNEFEKASKTS